MGRTYDVAEKIVWGDLCPRLDSISGDYDLFAEFHVGPDDNIADLIAKHFNSVPGVKDTNGQIAAPAMWKGSYFPFLLSEKTARRVWVLGPSPGLL